MSPPVKPFVYISQGPDSRFPATTFDPKSVTRASWKPKLMKPPRCGPLISFNRHPDSHSAPPRQTHPYLPIGPRARTWIKWVRRGQLVLRAVQLTGALGILTLMVIILGPSEATAWVMRITPGISVIHCLYATYHLARNAAARTPATSAAYQAFAVMLDLSVVSLYTYGAFSAHQQMSSWYTRFSSQDATPHLTLAVYYLLIGTGTLHLVSISVSLWLALTFRKISLMPPDVNPLEGNLITRSLHKGNESSVTSISTAKNYKVLSTVRLQKSNTSTSSYQGDRTLLCIPFKYTRAGATYPPSTPEDPQFHLPAGHCLPHHDTSSQTQLSCISRQRVTSRSSGGKDRLCTELLVVDSSSPSRCAVSTAPRRPKFTETLQPPDSHISRANRLFFIPGTAPDYSALPQHCSSPEVCDSEEEDVYNPKSDKTSLRLHPNPLRLHPTRNALCLSIDVSTSVRSLDSCVTKDELNLFPDFDNGQRQYTVGSDTAEGEPLGLRQIQDFVRTKDRPFSRLHGEPCASVSIGNNRKTSSGNDYKSEDTPLVFGRRNYSSSK
ncbi:hypothetical protein CDD83_2184 [Cordyceps sp. RAO-2017]|nr:hypothetical protein CDD83_2184 [Cordyceps sp. RAO-2017]